MIEITPGELRLVQQALARHLPQAKVIAFGSRVRGWPFGRGCKPFSDLDLAIESAQPLTNRTLAELRADLDDSALPWRVDLSPIEDLPPRLRALVSSHGVELAGPI